MLQFEQIKSTEPIRSIILLAFDMDMDICGGWGYGLDDALVIGDIDLPIAQVEHTLVSIRSHIEMSMTQEPSSRYGGINPKELSRESINHDSKRYEKVRYQISAMLESDYNRFINEYKDGYGKDSFDMAKHFKHREEATIKRDVDIYFQKS